MVEEEVEKLRRSEVEEVKQREIGHGSCKKTVSRRARRV
jgi:hypothetical protein